MDKGTPSRESVQCVLIIAMHNGKKSVFLVGAPAVYRSISERSSDDEVADELQMLDSNEPEHPDNELPIIAGGNSKTLCKDIKSSIVKKLDLPVQHFN